MYNILCMTDFYKLTHLMQFRPEIAHLTSYLTPRGSRIKCMDKMMWFGISNFVNQYLIEGFNKNFFELDWDVVAAQVNEALYCGLHYNEDLINNTLTKIKELWELGYLPIEINALPEGTLVPMGVPALEIRTTKDGYAWVGQQIESLLSCSIWHPCVSATTAYEYAKIAKKYYDKTVDDDMNWHTAMCDFSLRGQESMESAVASSAAWLTCFHNSSTVNARDYIQRNYSDGNMINIGGLTSTEHSVMTSDFALGGNERETYRRLLTKVYPKTSFAAVCDSYDFWRVLTEILPSLREEIEAHEGFLGVRHDSAEPVTALAGIDTLVLNGLSKNAEYDLIMYINEHRDEYSKIYGKENFEIRGIASYGISDNVYHIKYVEKGIDFYYTVDGTRETTYEDKGMVETIYELFGGGVNSKGYIAINPKLKAVYGDSITIPRAEAIYKRLEYKGFAANNVSLGVGSFSMEAIEEDGILKPFTRDTFSIAIKATYGRTFDGKEFPIFKDPKNFSAKKSLKGLCVPVWNGETNQLEVIQELDEAGHAALSDKNVFVNYFNGEIDQRFRRNRLSMRSPSFALIRLRVNKNLEGKYEH